MRGPITAFAVIAIVAIGVLLFSIDNCGPDWNRPTFCDAYCQEARELDALIKATDRDIERVNRMIAENDAIIARLKREIEAASQPSSQPASQP
jgi:hypothetical protein